jgi:DNA-binding MarR family transcriptional regulator
VAIEHQGMDRTPSSAEEVLHRHETFLIGAIANKLVNSGSALYRRRFGIGFTEWRIMVMLALEPGITAKRIGEVVGLDKAAISRGLKALQARRLIEPTPETAARRSRVFRLSLAGWELHGRIGKVAREHERLLLADISEEERSLLQDMLRRLLARTAEVEAFRPEGE